MSQFITNATTNLYNFSEIRRQIASGMLLVMALIAFITNIVTLTLRVFPTQQYLGFLFGGVCLIGYYFLSKKKAIEVIMLLPVVLLSILLITQGQSAQVYLIVIPLVIYTALTQSLPLYVLVVILTSLVAIIRQDQFPTTDIPLLFLNIITVTMGTGIYYVTQNVERITITTARTSRLLEASSNIAQVINRELDLQQLLENTVNIVREEFNFYHVQVFLIDENYEYANLVASTGEAGKQLIARNHRLPVGSQSVIGRVSQIGEPVIAQNTNIDTVHAINELLPDTKAELALPIMESGNIIGALDVQSTYSDAFQPIDIQALQIIANQLAIAIRNARLFIEAQRNLQENKRLLFEYETNLREVDRLNRSLTRQSWDTYITQSHIQGVTLTSDQFALEAEWSEAMLDATSQQQPQKIKTPDENVIALPIILRGQVLGAIEVAMDANTNVEDAAEMIQSISQRLAISLESARLFEETQEATLQEQQINEIVSSYETALTIDELLQITLEKLQQTLGAEKGVIRLGVTPDKDNTTHQHNGNGGTPL